MASLINRYERGTHKPKLETVKRLAYASGRIPVLRRRSAHQTTASLTKQQKYDLVKQIGAMPEK